MALALKWGKALVSFFCASGPCAPRGNEISTLSHLGISAEEWCQHQGPAGRHWSCTCFEVGLTCYGQACFHLPTELSGHYLPFATLNKYLKNFPEPYVLGFLWKTGPFSINDKTINFKLLYIYVFRPFTLRKASVSGLNIGEKITLFNCVEYVFTLFSISIYACNRLYTCYTGGYILPVTKLNSPANFR